MAEFANNLVLQSIRNLNTKWLGYRYIVFSVPNTPSVFQGILDVAGIATAGISEIDFPRMNVDLRRIPSLSTKDRYIPRHISHGDMVLRAPTIRQTALYNRIVAQAEAIGSKDQYRSIPESIVIAEYEASTAIDLLPLAVWSAVGAQPKSFKPAPANSQGSGIMPLEELVLQIDELKRL